MVRQMEKTCVFCKKDLPKEKEYVGPMARVVKYSCPRCGHVFISDECEWRLGEDFLEKNGYLISGALRWRTIKRMASAQPLKVQDVENLILSSEIPQTVPERVDRLIEYVGDRSHFFGRSVDLNPETDYPITFSPDQEEFDRIYWHLIERGILDKSTPLPYVLSMEGWARYYEIKQIVIDSKQCFIAMNFDSEYDPIYRKIEEAIMTCGFKPYCVKGIQHNDDVTDLIIAGIKKSRFLVADFSGERPSVYFEAGYAKALGKEVIWMCREGDKLHFDTRQYSHILWKDGEDLKRQLIDRIEATVK